MASSRLGEVALVFLKLGFTAFGGPAAHVGLLEREVVHRRRWLSHERFLDLLATTHLIPGPNSTELVIYLGHHRAGWAGLLVGGLAFILPAALIVSVCAWFYSEYARVPAVSGMLYGIKPVVIAVIAQAVWRLGKVALRSKAHVAFGVIASVVAACVPRAEIFVLLGAGVLFVVVRAARLRLKRPPATLMIVPAIPLLPAGLGAAAGAVPVGLAPLFLFFFKVGAILFGSGYVLVSFLRADLVTEWGWLTENQLLDAVAVGQMTPGPLFTTATFVGYILAGPVGAIVSTIGIFLPAFVFVAISGPLIPRLRRSPAAGAFLDGVKVSALALMAVVTWHLGQEAIVDVSSAALVVISTVILLSTRLNGAWLVLAGGAFGLVFG